MKIRVNLFRKVGLFLLIALVSITSHTVLPIPPPVLYLFTAIVLLPLMWVNEEKVLLDRVCVAVIFYLFYLLITQIFLETPFRRLMGGIFSPMFYVIVYFYLKKADLSFIHKLISVFINISILVFICEFYFRIINPIDLPNENTNPIYQYKNNSIMYSDSNGTGIHILTVLVFLLFLKDRVQIKYPLLKGGALFLLLLGTFSRAGWIVGIISVIGIDFFLHFKPYKLFLILSVTLLTAFYIYPIYLEPYFSSDASVEDHLNIFESAIEFVKSSNAQTFLFGIGFSLSEESLGRYAHNFFLTAIIETGLFGLLSNLLIFSLLIYGSKGRILTILLPFLMILMSSNLTFVPFFYMIAAVSMFLINKERVCGSPL